MIIRYLLLLFGVSRTKHASLSPGFKLLDENKNVNIPKAFYLQLLNKECKYINNEKNKVYPDLNPAASSQQELNPHNYRLAKITEVEGNFLNKISKREKSVKK